MMPSSWKEVRIDQTGEVQAGRQRSVHITQGTPRPYLHVANVFDGYIDTSDVLKMPFSDDEFATYRLEQGDILLNEGQSLELVGRSAVYEGNPPECCFQNTLIRFRPGSGISSSYARHLFQHLQSTGVFSSIAVKTTSIAHLGVERFAALRIPLPPEDEQARISELLSAWDRGSGVCKSLLEAKLRFKRGLLQLLLTGKWRFREFARYAWQEVRLADVTVECSRRNGNHLGMDAVMAVTKAEGIVPMREETIGANLERYKVVRKDWFAYNPMRVNIGSIARWTGDSDVLVSPDYVVFRCKAEADAGLFDRQEDGSSTLLLDPDFLDHFRRSRTWEQFVTASGNGSVRVRIYFNDMGQMRLRLPPIEEQKRIAVVLDTLDREIDLLRSELDALRQQKKGLMQKLLAGEIRVKV